MELHILKRKAEKKSEANRLRREGQIPAVIYHRSKEAETVSVSNDDFSAILRAVKQGHLPTTVFTLISEDKKSRKAILKDIQYNPTNYQVIHLDFEELMENVPVNVKVPVECIGIVDSIGIKLGGVLRQVIRHVRVNCLPKDIPNNFQLDVKEMEMADCKKVKDLNIPNNVRPLVNMNEVVAVIVKR